MDSKNMLQQIQADLCISEAAYPALLQVLGTEELKAWYRASRKPVDHQAGFREVNWFLTEKALIRQEISPQEIFFVSFNLNQIVHTEKYYEVRYDQGKQTVLRRAVITFTDGKNCDLSVPSSQSQGDTDGFINLVHLLA